MAPDSDPNNNGVVLTDRVTHQGQTLPSATLEFFLDNQLIGQSTADGQGRFEFTLTLEAGQHSIRTEARDQLGRSAQTELQVRRGNAIQDWNTAILDIVRQWTATSNDPSESHRAIATAAGRTKLGDDPCGYVRCCQCCRRNVRSIRFRGRKLAITYLSSFSRNKHHERCRKRIPVTIGEPSVLGQIAAPADQAEEAEDCKLLIRRGLELIRDERALRASVKAAVELARTVR